MSYATAYEIGLGKKPISSNLLDQNIMSPVIPVQKSHSPTIPQFGSSNPLVWGPIFWYTLHNSAAHYPVNASPLVKQRMKNRILAIPYEISCRTCQPHASAYIESISDDKLNEIVSGRDNLFKFYVDFHNDVNKRLGKPIWSYEQAYDYYNK
jgi:hypothetical protein